MKFCPKCSKEYPDDIAVCASDSTALVIVGRNTDPLLGGTFAGRYQFVEKIGQGGMGAVYKAIHTRMNRTCAIKLLAADQAEGHAAVERFNREAQMASSIGNPHAVVIYDFGETEDGVLYLVMEYVDGEPLSRALLREGTFTPGRACAIARQIADALGAAHALGIVHRDLKPDNVMLSKREAGADYVKVLDFGIAKTVSHDVGEDLTQTGFVLGTPAYMSPEQLSGDKLDARSDIYSLALIVYQMLSGKLPFEGDSTQARLIKRLVDSPVPLRSNAPSISAEIEASVMSGLARNRDDRPASAAMFARALEACIQPGLSSVAIRPTVPVSSLPASLVTAGGLASPTSPQSGGVGAESRSTGADSLPTTPVAAQVNSANDPGTQGYDSPSSYVTQQSTTPMVSGPGSGSGHGPAKPSGPESTPGAGHAAMPPGQSLPQHARQIIPEQGSQIQTRQSPLEQPSPVTPETVAFPSGASQVSATRVRPGISPTALSPVAAGQSLNNAGGKKTGVGLVIAVLAIGLLLVAVGGTVVYLKYFRNAPAEKPFVSGSPLSSPGPTVRSMPTPAPTASAAATTQTPLAGAPLSAEASARVAAGKQHQEQARMLAGSGSASEASEEYRKAIAEYKEAIKLEPMNPEVHENLGVAFYDSGRIAEAADEYRLAIDQYIALHNGPTAQVMVNYGLALFDSKRYRDAAAAFGRALQIDPGDHDLYAHRGFALQNAGDYESAKQDYHEYLTLEPSGQYALAVTQILAGRAQPPSQSGNR